MAESATNGASPKTPSLTTTYTSPTNAPFTHTTPLPAPTDKAAYLSALRTATTQMQEQVNKELTARMEQDKALADGGVDEAKEEDNYGEEVAEDDA
ncbi:hypothetical protein LSUE1_G006439 [Lachnellula suecica]|uniref:EKC/KEOPS complex subunit GON7 n=1 Tax=Lachnellula suecica TaxID=602035 RepID=A0A8T9C201_9HELO|nr:hypothetical protein LSUE1_G006439 [Lachnellula suecica]